MEENEDMIGQEKQDKESRKTMVRKEISKDEKRRYGRESNAIAHWNERENE